MLQRLIGGQSTLETQQLANQINEQHAVRASLAVRQQREPKHKT
jgi:hypothetical protein